MPTVLITGASSGIGKSLSRHFLNLDWKVIMIARRENLMEKLSNEFPLQKKNNKICIIKADLTDENDCIKACEKSLKFCNNKLNLLINNAGGLVIGTVENCTIKDWKYSMDLNLTSAFIMSKFMFPALQNVKGSIINISSICGSVIAPEVVPYCVAKAGLEHLTRNNAVEFGYKNVRVNCIEPGMMKIAGQSKGFHNRNKTYFPGNRLGNLNDIIQIVMFLCDNNKSGWINGQIIRMDGGKNGQWIGSKM